MSYNYANAVLQREAFRYIAPSRTIETNTPKRSDGWNSNQESRIVLRISHRTAHFPLTAVARTRNISNCIHPHEKEKLTLAATAIRDDLEQTGPLPIPEQIIENFW
jgi:hypothetical protein